MSETAFHWEIDHFEIHERSTGWYVLAALVVGGLLVYSIASKNLLFGIIIILVTVTVFARQLQEPRKSVCEISDKGIRLGDKSYTYSDIQAFSLIEIESGRCLLYIQEDRGLRSLIPVPLDGQDPDEIRSYLSGFILEDQDHIREPFLDWLIRKLKL